VSSPIPFRPTETARDIINDYMKEHKLKSRSQAVNEIIENFATQSEPSKPETVKAPEFSQLFPCATCYYEYTPDDFYTNPKYDDMLFPPTFHDIRGDAEK